MGVETRILHSSGDVSDASELLVGFLKTKALLTHIQETMALLEKHTCIYEY